MQNNTANNNNFINDNNSLLTVKEVGRKNYHENEVYFLCLLRKNKFASCSLDKSIIIYSLETYQCESVFFGHFWGVTSVSELSNGLIISSAYDNNIKVWDNNTYQCLSTLTNHNNYVHKVSQITKNRICSCSSDQTLKIWNDFPPYKCIKTLWGHSGPVISFIELKSKNYIVSAGNGNSSFSSTDETVRFWKNDSYECQAVIDNIKCWMNGLAEIGTDKLIVGGANEISVIQTNTLTLEKKILTDGCFVYSFLPLTSQRFLCGCSGGKSFVADLCDEGTLNIEKKIMHSFNIYCLILFNDTLLTCSQDKLIKIWKK